MGLTASLEMYLSAVWTDVSADVVRDAMRMSRGILGSGPTDRVARPGSLSFTLDNSVKNSAATMGYYSPGHASVRTGFNYGTLVRLKLTDGTSTRYKFRGKLRTIAPDAGINSARGTACVAFDLMNRLAEFDTEELALLESKRSDELITAVLDLMATAEQPVVRDLDIGLDTYAFAFDDLGGDTRKGLTLIDKVCRSELGYFYVRGDATGGETATFENRHARANAASAFSMTGAHFQGLDVPSSLDAIRNDVKVQIWPRFVDPAATAVLVSLDNSPLVSAGETIVIWVDFRDPNQESEFVGGKEMIQPVATTDYTANTSADGSGSNITSSFTVTASYFGSRAKITVTNGGTQTGYLRGPGSAAGMQCRGKGLYRYAPITSRAQNATSIAAYGLRPMPSILEAPYQSDRIIGQSMADFLANLYGAISKIPIRVPPFVANKTAALLEQVILRDIGDKITITESVTGVSAVQVFLHAIELDIAIGGVPTMASWTLCPADTSKVLIWDDAIAGTLDSGNTWGYA